MNSSVLSRLAIEDKDYISRGREVFIRLSLLAVMAVSCVLLMRPFLNFIVCGIIIAIGIYPGYRMLTKALGGREKLAAVIWSVLLLAVVIVPAVLLAGTLIDGVQTISVQVQSGHLELTPPPEKLVKLPLIGSRIAELWNLCSTNLSEAIRRFGPQIEKFVPGALAASAGIGSSILQFILAILLAGYLLATSAANGRFADRIFARLFGEQGPEFKDLVASTIRTVANGVLGVALIQSFFASLGFWIFGIPAAGLWAMFFLVAAILQVGALVLIPAVIYAFGVFSTTRAVSFLAWCIVVGVMDNVLKPILLGRGAKVPMAVIFLGVLGGFIATNRIIGLFVGAIILSVGYKLFIAWLDSGAPSSSYPSE